MKLFSLVIVVVLLAGCSFANNQIDPAETNDVEETAEFDVQMIVAQAAAQSVAESTAQAPTTTPLPTATAIPIPTPTSRPMPTLSPSSSPTPTSAATRRPTPTPTQAPTPTPTPIPRVLGQKYQAADGVYVTVKSLNITEAGNATTVSISYTLENTTGDLKEEKAWKLFYQGPGGTYFGVRGELPPNQSIDRSFTFSAVAPHGLLMLAYPSELSDISWDQDDLTWSIAQLFIN